MNKLSSILIDWYNINKRDLPWRDTHDPYIIWLSEIILQQTRVAQGYSYFMRFVEEFPTVVDLAKANEDDVLKLWQGLGYYSRARNLHAAAQMVVSQFGGVFPTDYKDVLSLKGVGKYTAAAIVSFAYNLPYAVVDGNVYRVLSRLFAIDTSIDSTPGEKEFAALAQELLDKKNAGLYNQAIMDFGALQCVPVSPDCHNCPASDICLAYAKNQVSQYPVKKGKTKVRNRYFNYIDIRYKDLMYLNKRGAKDIWQNLYELPLIETDKSVDWNTLSQDPRFRNIFEGVTISEVSHVCNYKHVLSHQILYASFYRVSVKDKIMTPYIEIPVSDIDSYAVSRLVEKYLDEKDIRLFI